MKKPLPFSTPAAGAVLGVLTGLLDWMCIVFNWSNARAGLWYLPPLAWLTVIATSATLCCFVAALLSSPRLTGLRAVMLALAGPGILLAGRALAPLRVASVLMCAAITAAIAIALYYLPTKPSRYNAAWLAASLLAGLTLAFLAWDPAIGSSSAKGRQSPQPNVILIFLDTVRYDDAIGGAHPAMPLLRAFANRSTSFENAWAPAPWTVPSHLAVMTGRDPWAVPDDGVTLAETLRARGYDTAAIAANPLIGNPRFFRGYGRFTYSNASGVCRSAAASLVTRAWAYGLPRSPVCGWFTASQVTRRARRFMASARPPFFLTLNYMDAHYPYYIPAECPDLQRFQMSRGDRDTFHQMRAGKETWEQAHANYRAALTCMDRSMGVLLAGLERDPNTIIAVVGDHGEQFGEHGLIEHGNSVYRQVLQVPLVIKRPGEPRTRTTTPTAITDLYRLILHAPSPPRPVMSSYYVWSGPLTDTGGFSAVAGDLHYIRWRDGREALYNYTADPAETRAVSAPDPKALELLRSETSRASMNHERVNEFRALEYIQ